MREGDALTPCVREGVNFLTACVREGVALTVCVRGELSSLLV